MAVADEAITAEMRLSPRDWPPTPVAGEAGPMGRGAMRRFKRTDGSDLVHPVHLKRRLPGPGRGLCRTIFALPPRGYLWELRVTAWILTPPPRPHDRSLAPFGEDELRLHEWQANAARPKRPQDPEARG